MRSRSMIAVIVLTLAATTSLVLGQAKQDPAESKSKGSIVGTWQVLRHGADCTTGDPLGPDFQALMTFNAGGTYAGYTVTPGSTIANSTPEHGIWAHGQGVGAFSFRIVGYNWDDSGTYVGRGEITSTDLQVAPDGLTFTYDATIDVYNADGTLLFSFCGHGSGTRFQ